MRAVRPLAFAQRAHEICERPAADAGLRMRLDVRAVERTERRLERASAGIRHGVLTLFGVTAKAAARLGEVLAALRIALRQCERSPQQKKKPRQGGASLEPQTLLLLAEAFVAAAAGFADGADLRLHRPFVAAAAHLVELVRLVLQAAPGFLELVGLLVDRRERGAFEILGARIKPVPRHAA